MAISEQGRQQVAADLNRHISTHGLSCGITKADLRAAADAIDDFFDTNATAINNAFPQPARGALSAPMKAWIVSYVAARRAAG